MTKKIISALLIAAINLTAEEVIEYVQTEKIGSLLNKNPYEASALMGRKPYLSSTEKLEKVEEMVWFFFPKDCDKCGEWVSLHPNDKTPTLWLPKQDCGHKNIVKGDRRYFGIYIHFMKVYGEFLCYKAEYKYVTRAVLK